MKYLNHMESKSLPFPAFSQEFPFWQTLPLGRPFYLQIDASQRVDELRMKIELCISNISIFFWQNIGNLPSEKVEENQIFIKKVFVEMWAWAQTVLFLLLEFIRCESHLATKNLNSLTDRRQHLYHLHKFYHPFEMWKLWAESLCKINSLYVKEFFLISELLSHAERIWFNFLSFISIMLQIGFPVQWLVMANRMDR